MANMSYCRWHNTSRDLADCVEALNEGDAENGDLSEMEREGKAYLLREVGRLFQNLGIDYDTQDLEEAIEDCRKGAD